METNEILREGWMAFCDHVSRLHRGWQVDVEVQNGDGEPRPVVRDLPFGGLIAELETGGEDRVQIVAGDQPGQHIVHTVGRPARIWHEEAEAGTEVIRIESSLGQVTTVRLNSAGRPARPDGL